eukprot:GFUD01034229.1.p1 GENE.GFUD01034229.1~~GFUD01034229.1.p1  ORF type:complete len:160 (+),score=35.02 GFUD01034229.1:84-563(+)
MVIDYASHGLAKPNSWNRPACRVYDSNRRAGSFYYEPMLEYIDRKSIIGEDVASKAVRMHTVLNRKQVVFPQAHEVSEDCSSSALRLGNFLTTYRAKQMKQRNTKTVHVKNEIVRQSKSAETLVDKRTSTMIRDQYINMLSLMYKEGVGHMPSIPDTKY